MVRSGNGASTISRLTAIGGTAIVLVGLSACTSGSDTKSDDKPSSAARSGTGSAAAPSGSSSSVAGDVTFTTSVTGGLKKANPAKPVTVSVADGSLKSVKLVNPAGKVVSGSLAADNKSWKTTEPLGYAKTYSLTATAENGNGNSAVKRERITTLTPDNMTMPYFNTVNGTSITNNGIYGVGMIVKLHFDEPIADKDAAEKAVKVTTSPSVDGAWYWLNDQDAHWRPRSYYAPGTTVKVDANVYGADLGQGLYGQSDQSISFKIDDEKRTTVASAKTHRVKVYRDDKLVKNMPTSMGRGGYVQGKDGKISLWTPNGTYTVITKENPAIMRSDSYGLPTNSPDGYGRLVVPWATKISTDGIYLHQLRDTIPQQGNTNVSHGCLNLNPKNAKWFFQNSRVGDPVTIKDSGGSRLEVWRGGDWSVSWSTWVKGGDK